MRNLSLFNIKKWYKMMIGKSILHVRQDIGQVYSISEICGYYNDLTKKVTNDKNFDQLDIPRLELENRKKIFFPISIFQYGLGAYDLYLICNKQLYKTKFLQMCFWALKNQNTDGSWNNFDYIYPQNPFSAMAQGEGASLLIRGYRETKDVNFLEAAKRAIDFMLLPVEKGGTSYYTDKYLYLMEYTNKPTVLNGWIFAIFGLYDLTKVVSNMEYEEKLNRTLFTLERNLYKFDLGFWSSYNVDKSIITSKFYHELHIAQLSVLYNMFKIEEFQTYAEKWLNNSKKRTKRVKAFVIKVYQKLFEK